MISIKYLVQLLLLISTSFSQYALKQTLQRFTQYELSDATISPSSQFIFAKVASDFYIFKYTSRFDIFQVGTGWSSSSKLSSSSNSLMTGVSAWVQSPYEFEPIQNLSDCKTAVISPTGLSAACYNTAGIYIWERTNTSGLFKFNYTISIFELVTDLIFSENGSMIAVASPSSVYIYRKNSTSYRLYDLFEHGFPPDNKYPPQIVASNDFSIIVARDNETLNFFNSTNSSYKLYKNASYSVIDWTMDSRHLVIAEANTSQVLIFQKNGTDFNYVQNISLDAVAVASSNGTLITAGKFKIIVWENITYDLNK